MRHAGRICAAMLMVAAPVCFAQTPHEAKKASKPEPTQLDLFNYVRGKLLALSPSDGINDNLEVAFDEDNYVLTITQPDGRCEIFLGAIDANTALWEAFDPSDTYHTREDVLRLTMTSLSGKKARICYDNQNQVNTSIPTNHVRLLFSMPKANAVPKFTDKMTTAIKKLVALAGGNADKDPI
ncbi:MAG: hypothetical protein ACLPY1_12965 [Terracidiphilus sp.]